MATPGNWFVGGTTNLSHLRHTGWDAVVSEDRGVIVSRAVYSNYHDLDEYDLQTKADIEFIANCKQDVPLLLEEIDRLNKYIQNQSQNSQKLAQNLLNLISD